MRLANLIWVKAVERESKPVPDEHESDFTGLFLVEGVFSSDFI
jgi:hypothetical protein